MLSVRRFACQDHPRIRGEHSMAQDTTAPITGIIPAYAGSTEALDSSDALKKGSSPHTRGAPTTAT